MEKLIEKIRGQRKNEAPVKNDYAALAMAIAKTEFDKSINDSEEIAKEADEALSVLDEFSAFCLEERFLRGKTLDEVADELRGAFDLDAEGAADTFIDETLTRLKQIFMTSVDEIVFDMQSHSFEELRELHNRKKAEKDGSADPSEKTGVYSRIIDIIYDSIEELDSVGYCYADIFKGYFLEGESKTALTIMLSDDPEHPFEVTGECTNDVSDALCNAVLDKVEGMFYDMQDNGFPELKAPDPDGSSKRGATIGLDGSDRVIDVLKDSIAYLDKHGNYYRDVFEKIFLQGLAKEQLAKHLSENMKEYVNVGSSYALRHLRAQKRGNDLIRTARNLNRRNDASE